MTPEEREDKIKAANMLALQSWYRDYRIRYNREPTHKEIWVFIQALNERVELDNTISPELLAEEENRIKEIASKICKQEGWNEEHFTIKLLPSLDFVSIIKPGCPAEITFGIRLKDPDLKEIIRRSIRRALKVYRPSALVPIGKMLEYKREAKRFIKSVKGESYLKLVNEERLQVVEHRTYQVIDMETGIVVTGSKEVSRGMFSHYRNDPLAKTAQFDISRILRQKGLLKDEDELEEDNE